MNTKTKLSVSDQQFLMGTALLECAIAENISIDTIHYFLSKKTGNWYIVSNEKDENGKPVKVYFKKHQDTF